LLVAYLLRFCAGKLIVCTQSIPSVHRRRSTSHVDGKRNGLDNLFPGSSMLMGHLGVVGDAAVAVDRDADRGRGEQPRYRAATRLSLLSPYNLAANLSVRVGRGVNIKVGLTRHEGLRLIIGKGRRPLKRTGTHPLAGTSTPAFLPGSAGP
jgi:hypothetical protein